MSSDLGSMTHAEFVNAYGGPDSLEDYLEMQATAGIGSSAKRVVTTTDDATAVIDVAVTDVYELSAVANATEFSTTGTPSDGQQLLIRFKDAGVAKAITWNAVFVAIGVTLPTTTTAGKWTYVHAAYNLAATKFHVLATATEA